MKQPIRTLVSVAVVGILATSTVHAGAFSLYTEDSAASIGNYAAGIAAEAADASTGWYNPAGLALIRNKQAVFGGVGIFPVAKLTGTSTFSLSVLEPYTQSFSGLNGATYAFVPSSHFALPVGENLTFGLSVISPFGLSTDWAEDSPVRYQGTFTELLTTNVSPQFGAKVSENFAIGAGLDFQYARVKFNTMLGVPALFTAPGLNPSAVDTLSYNNGNSIGVGFHAGVMGMFNDKHTRVGINYQSKMRHDFHGQSRLVGKLASPGLNLGDPASVNAANPDAVFKNNQLFSNPIQLPDVVTISGYHDVNEAFAVLGSFVWTGWNSFSTIQLNNVAAPSINTNNLSVSQVMVNSETTQAYTDAWRIALGANYHVNQKLMLRVGGGYDVTPTNDEHRDVRLPDGTRWALSVGAHYQMRPTIGFDLGYTHLFVPDESVLQRTENIGAAQYRVNALASASVDLVGAQVVWTLDKMPEIPSK